MYEIITYKSESGKDEISEYVKELSKKSLTSKTHRIKLKKIIQYLDLLRSHGTEAGLPAIKHIEDKLWELRPTDDRIFFFYWQENMFVLVHHFKKQTQKTPSREIEKAKKNMKNFIREE